ncbi:partner of Y14 and mago-like [Primulina eburnea]|uniref:partner of Y14 and mago-like n=1 Tax=Primulina eburnea TaxID=1245227 RepID=UPI003C6C95AD
MASGGTSGGAADDAAEELGKTPNNKGERILAPTRRPDGTLRKPVRIRAGYVPQDEVAIYQSKGLLWRKEMEAVQEVVPPGYDPAAAEVKSKSKSAKRNERKKEKRQKAALDKADVSEKNDVLPADGSNHLPEKVEPIASMMDGLTLSGNTYLVTTPSNPNESSTPEDQIQYIDKKIRALKKKIRLTEAQQQKTTEKDMKPEQLEKIAKLEDWHDELKLLEETNAELTASMS